VPAPDALIRLIAFEVGRIPDPTRREALRGLLIEPLLQHRGAEFGDSGARYPTWLIGRGEQASIGLAYSEFGYGPETPWGYVSISHLSLGTEAQWFSHLDDAFIASGLAGTAKPG